LFVSYPEVDWLTAQQVCRGIDGQLASISTSDEQRFVTANVRNHVDYTPRSFYWLGGELSQNFGFEWTDGTAMAFQVNKIDLMKSRNLLIRIICTGLATRTRTRPEKGQKPSMSWPTMEDITNTHATFRFILVNAKMFN
jgi:hypothetical protein